MENETTFELQWIEELVGKSIGFSENSPNALVVESIPLYYETETNRTALDLEVDWENITPIEGGFIFPLISPTSISLKNQNFTYDKVFYCSPVASKYNDFLKQRLTEWKADQKPFIFYKAYLSFDNWISIKESKNLYILGHKGQFKANDLTSELNKEIPFLESGITGWLKLPYQQREKFIKRNLEGDEEVENMKNEIEAAIRSLENNKPDKPSDPNPNQNDPKNASPDKLPRKVVIPISLAFLLVLVLVLVIGIVAIVRKRRKK